MVMRFPANKNAGCPKAPCDFPPRKDGILCPRQVVLGLPPPPTECADGRTYGCTDVWTYGCTDGRSRDYYVTTKISRIDRLHVPYFLSNGAPLAGFARRLRYKSLYYSLKPGNDVYCLKLNFNISKLGYYSKERVQRLLLGLTFVF